MPDDLYDRDVLGWSERQAKLLRLVAGGEFVSDGDWENVIEEIEDVGRSELNNVRLYLSRVLVNLLKLRGWPELSAWHHWRSEIVGFQFDAARSFAPSMRSRIDLADIFRTAVRQVEPLRYSGDAGLRTPGECPVFLDQLLNASIVDLEAAFTTRGTN
jgi:hypothetical protein